MFQLCRVKTEAQDARDLSANKLANNDKAIADGDGLGFSPQSSR
jgi:hypothetical protein